MFTGIVEELGTVRAVEARADGILIEIASDIVLADAVPGASIAVNGCCLTVVDRGDRTWSAEAVPETMARTNLGRLDPHDVVNLERPLAADGRFGGHIVQGHIDGTTTVTAVIDQTDGSRRISFAGPAGLTRYIVEKGSIAIDGISLTVAALADDGFDVAVIPHTLVHTTLGRRRVGDMVNIETDVLAKHVEKLLAVGATAHVIRENA